MSTRALFAGGLALAVALASPQVALAAKQRKKPATSAPVEPAPQPKPAETKAEEPKPEAPKPEAPKPEAPKPEASKPEASKPEAPKPELPDEPVATLQPGLPAVASDSSDDLTALGRREAARIEAGRIEVGVWLSGGVANRRFTYNDAVGDELATYRLPAAPMASVGLEAYPAASTDIPFVRDLGLRGHVSRGFAFDSNTPQGVQLETSWTRFGGELRERLLVPGRHALELGVLVGADASYFGMTAKAPVPALLPAARTVALRFGFDVRLLVAWRLSLLAGGAYLLTTSRGEIYAHFRNPQVAGVDGDLGFAIDLSHGFELRLAARYTRYFAAFEPRLGDRYVAGGALDEQLQTSLGARYAH